MAGCISGQRRAVALQQRHGHLNRSGADPRPRLADNAIERYCPVDCPRERGCRIGFGRILASKRVGPSALLGGCHLFKRAARAAVCPVRGHLAGRKRHKLAIDERRSTAERELARALLVREDAEMAKTSRLSIFLEDGYAGDEKIALADCGRLNRSSVVI